MQVYPERGDAPAPLADRLIAGLRFQLQRRFARALPRQTPFVAEVGRHAARWRAADPTMRLADLRYRLRRDGLSAHLLAECFGVSCAVLPGEIGSDVLEAARWLVVGGIAELAEPSARRHALLLAAAARAIHGDFVHLLTPGDVAARSLADELRAPLAALGIRVGCIAQGQDPATRRENYACAVVCGAPREIGRDYLRDGIRAGGRPGALSARLERLSGTAADGQALLLKGLQCALVEEADTVMLDDAHAPLVVAKEADTSRERLPYEQAMELARSLAPGEDFTLESDGARLARPAARRLEQLVAPLGGIWAQRERREALVVLALEALHRLRPGVDYRVEGGRVVFPPASGKSEEAAAREREFARLVEVKEGCRFSASLEVAARLPLPRFFGRYLSLAGVCADARGLEQEFWELYELKSARAGPRRAPAAAIARVFLTAVQKASALIESVRAAAGAGRTALVCVRSAAAAAQARAALSAAGLEAACDIAVFPSMPASRPTAVEILVCELHDAERHVQAICRACLASEFTVLLSLEDPAVALHLGALVARAAQFAAGADGELSRGWSGRVARLAQRRAEGAARASRLEQKSSFRSLGDLLAVSGQRE